MAPFIRRFVSVIALIAALQAVGVKIYIRGQLWDGSAAIPQNP